MQNNKTTKSIHKKNRSDPRQSAHHKIPRQSQQPRMRHQLEQPHRYSQHALAQVLQRARLASATACAPGEALGQVSQHQRRFSVHRLELLARSHDYFLFADHCQTCRTSRSTRSLSSSFLFLLILLIPQIRL